MIVFGLKLQQLPNHKNTPKGRPHRIAVSKTTEPGTFRGHHRENPRDRSWDPTQFGIQAGRRRMRLQGINLVDELA